MIGSISKFQFEQINTSGIRLILSWKIMNGLKIFIVIALLYFSAFSQEVASPETMTYDQVVALPQHVETGAPVTNTQHPTNSQQSIRSAQQTNNHAQTSQTQSIQSSNRTSSQHQPQVHSIPPEQYKQHANVNNDQQLHHTTQSQTPQHSQHFKHIGEASPGLALHTLTAEQQQQMLRQQQLLDQHSIHDSTADLWKYGNYTQEQMRQLEKKWEQQAKQAYQNALKDMEERERRERQEIERMIEKEKLTKTQEISHKQTLQFRDRQNRFNPKVQFEGKTTRYRHHFNDYMFELGSAEFQDFEISLVAAQTIAIHSETYSNNEGVYSRTTQIDDQIPPELQVYENGNQIIANQKFFFKKFITFEGKANTKYLIRMNNPGQPRLFSLSVVQIVDQSQISHALTSTDLASHGQRAAKLYEQLKQNMQNTHSLAMMTVSNQNKLNKGISHYYMYNIGQLVLVIAVCLVQVKFIEKLLTQNSIV